MFARIVQESVKGDGLLAYASRDLPGLSAKAHVGQTA